MKQLITKSDGKPTKSKVFAKQFLQEKGIDESCLIEENGQFFYEDSEKQTEVIEEVKPKKQEKSHSVGYSPVTWETPVYDKKNERTKLVVPGTDVVATITAKHPAGQLGTVSRFALNIGQENFLMSIDLVSKLFKVKEAE